MRMVLEKGPKLYAFRAGGSTQRIPVFSLVVGSRMDCRLRCGGRDSPRAITSTPDLVAARQRGGAGDDCQPARLMRATATQRTRAAGWPCPMADGTGGDDMQANGTSTANSGRDGELVRAALVAGAVFLLWKAARGAKELGWSLFGLGMAAWWMGVWPF
jgi:hypothetical protein